MATDELGASFEFKFVTRLTLVPFNLVAYALNVKPKKDVCFG